MCPPGFLAALCPHGDRRSFLGAGTAAAAALAYGAGTLPAPTNSVARVASTSRWARNTGL